MVNMIELKSVGAQQDPVSSALNGNPVLVTSSRSR